LSTVGSGTSEMSRAAGPLPPLRIPAWIRYFDLIVLVAALPLFLFADLPMAAYIVGGAAWVIQRAIQVAVHRRAKAAGDVRVAAGLTAASMIAQVTDCAESIGAVRIRSPLSSRSRLKVLTAAMLPRGNIPAAFLRNAATRGRPPPSRTRWPPQARARRRRGRPRGPETPPGVASA